MLRFFAALSALGLAGCGELLGADEYSVTPPAKAYQSSADIFPPKCQACVREACATEVASCDESASCDQAARCVYGHFDPGGSAQCSHLLVSTQASLLGLCAADQCIPDCDPELPWACVEKYDFPAPKAKSASLDIQYLDFGTGKPLPDVTVKACDRRDPSCSGPGSPYDQALTDADGKVLLTVPMLKNALFGLGPDGFDGFFELTGAGIAPNLRYGKNPIITDAVISGRIVSQVQLQQLLQLTKLDLAPDRGVVNVEAFDCVNFRPKGLRFELSNADGETRSYYFRNGLPDPTATETSVEGMGGFVNVPAGTATVHAYRVEGGQEVSFAAVSVRPGTVTALGLSPSPRPN